MRFPTLSPASSVSSRLRSVMTTKPIKATGRKDQNSGQCPTPFEYVWEHSVGSDHALSFMPETLASGSETVFRYRSNVTPPVADVTLEFRNHDDARIVARG